MDFHRFGIVLRRTLGRSLLLQIGVLFGFWWVGDRFVRLVGLQLPGGVIAMALVLLLLAGGQLRLSSVRRGAKWLLAEMLLFFVPAVPAVMDHRELLGWIGLKLLLVIIAGTVAVMGTTGFVVELVYTWRSRHCGSAFDAT